MKRFRYAVVVVAYILRLAAAPLAIGIGDFSYNSPEWRIEVSKGYLPYHRLAATDFPIDDVAHLEVDMYTRGFFHYHFNYHWTPKDHGAIARVTEWTVRSGFDRNKSSRKSWFRFVQETLPHEQGHLDINEIYSRRLARLTLEELPVGEGATPQAAIQDLTIKLKALSDRTAQESRAEQDAYDAATLHGKNIVAQREWNMRIQMRLKQAGINVSPRF